MMASPMRNSKVKIKPVSSATPSPAYLKLAQRRQRLAKEDSSHFLDFLPREPYKDETPAATPSLVEKLVASKCRSLIRLCRLGKKAAGYSLSRRILICKEAKKVKSFIHKIQNKEGSISRQLFHGTAEDDAEESSPPIIKKLFKDEEGNHATTSVHAEEGSRSIGEANKDVQSGGLLDIEERRMHQELQRAIKKDLLFNEDVKSPKSVVKQIRKYMKNYRETASFDIVCAEGERILQVVHMNSEEILSKIAKLKVDAHRDYIIPSRADAYQEYNFKSHRYVLIRKGAETKKTIMSLHKFEVFDALLTIIYELCIKEKNMEIRSIYYKDPELFRSRDKVSAAIDDLCCMMCCTRSSLHVYASEKGCVFGDISFSVGTHRYNCTSGGIHGTPIPSRTDQIRSMKNKGALFILVVEKETVFERLIEDGFCKKYRCILITAKGMPDVASRFFLSKMRSEFKLDVFALMDFDPYGMKILSVFRNGSKNMSFDSKNLTTPDIKLLGMLHTDIDKYQIPDNLKLRMTEFDIKTANSLLGKPYFSVEEKNGLRYMLETGVKCEVEAWYYHGIEYLTKVVLPLKIQDFLVSANTE